MNRNYADFISTDLPIKNIRGIPVILPENTSAIWHRELIEVILWQYPEKIKEMYEEINFSKNPADITEVYIKWIRNLLVDKNGILNAFFSNLEI